MKEHDLLDAIGEIDEKFIKQAGETKGVKNESIESIKENDNRGSNEKSSRGDNGSSKIGGNSKNTGIRSGNRNYFKWGLAAAAVMCALIAGGIIFKHSTNSNNNSLGGTASDKTDTLLYGGDDNTETATYDGEETAVTTEEEASESEDGGATEGGESGTEAYVSDDEEGVYIPMVELPKNTSEGAMDMVGLIVYKGRIYIQGEEYVGEAAEQVSKLVGEHLGTAKGNIDEWSSQEKWATEFASTIAGEVYSVDGYNESFRICMMYGYKDEENAEATFIQFYNCLNGITLMYGKGIFEDRLHIGGNVEEILWQEHSDWNNAIGKYQTAELDEETWEEFLNQIDAGEFINTRDPYNDMYNPSNGASSIYDTDKMAHVILKLKDGTTVHLRLIEGGYVGYDMLSWYFVKIPEEIFNKVYDACGGTH